MNDLGKLWWEVVHNPCDPVVWSLFADCLNDHAMDPSPARLLAFAFDNWPNGRRKEQLTVRCIGPEEGTGVAEGLGLFLARWPNGRWLWFAPNPQLDGAPMAYRDRDGVVWHASRGSGWRWWPAWECRLVGEDDMTIHAEPVQTANLAYARNQAWEMLNDVGVGDVANVYLVPPGGKVSEGQRLDEGGWRPVSGHLSPRFPRGGGA